MGAGPSRLENFASLIPGHWGGADAEHRRLARRELSWISPSDSLTALDRQMELRVSSICQSLLATAIACSAMELTVADPPVRLRRRAGEAAPDHGVGRQRWRGGHATTARS